jgi:hypothetical protein
MSSIHVVYAPLDINSEQARDARALALRFALDCYAKKKSAHPGGPDDAKERFENDSRAKSIIPK